MDQQELARFRRILLIYLTACVVGGFAASLLLYILLPIEAVLLVGVVILVVSLVVGIQSIRRIRAIGRSRDRGTSLD